MSNIIKVNRIIKMGAIGGAVLVAIGLLGVRWANTVNSESALGIFAYILYSGLIGFVPIALRLAITIIKFLWTLFKRALSEIFYEVTRAIECGKNGDRR